MSNLSWWRSWHGAPMDHKYQVIAIKAKTKVGIVAALMWALLDYASQNNPRGSIDGFDTEIYSVYSGFEEEEIIRIILVMTEKGIVKDKSLINWEKRQPKREDDSYNRVTKHRSMKRNVTQCNAPDKDTDKDTDKELDTESETEIENRERVLSDFDETLDYLKVLTGYPASGKASVDAINDIIKMKATVCDVRNGFEWLANQGKTVRYYSSLVGPTQTAMSKRIQQENLKPKKYEPILRKMVHPDGTVEEVLA